MRATYFAFTALLQLAFSQDSTTTITDFAPSSTTATPTSSQPVTQTIAVGLGGHVFSPSVLQVGVGNYVDFEFYPTNHSVIRAEYQFPCVPYELTGVDKVGFYSGFQPVDAILPDPPKFSILINDTDPIFFYCGAPDSCIKWQMVGVINPNASVSLEVQKDYAANSSFMLLPGESWPSESDPFATTSTAAPTSTSTSSSSTSTVPTAAATSSAAEPSESHKSTLSPGAIAGIAIGGAAVAIAAAALLFFCGRKSRRGNTPPPSAPPGMAGATNPPAYMPPNKYGYEYRGSLHPQTMSSTANKHMSMATAPVPMTDAFGNPTGNYIPGGYPQPFMAQQQGYPPHMQPMMAPQWPQSPSNDIFGNTPPQVPHEQQPLVSGNEHGSVRASSPSSVNVAPTPANGGIEAFLQRQSRMSPPPQIDLHLQQSSPLISNQNQQSGPYEMSATGTMPRSS